MIVEVFLSAALICFSGQCHHALVGPATPTGEYPLRHVPTTLNGYGGDVMGFAQDKGGMYAVHRVWLLSPKQHRRERLASDNPADRRSITNGCINVDPVVYQTLVDCCTNATIVIKE
jgi:hypothetical protein